MNKEVIRMSEEFSGFNIRLINKMAEYGVSQADLCRKTGLATSMISHYCTGQRVPSVQVVAKIAKALNTSIDYLAAGDNCTNIQDSPDGFSVAEKTQPYKSGHKRETEKDDKTLINNYHALNTDGKVKLRSYLEDLLCVDKYCKKS